MQLKFVLNVGYILNIIIEEAQVIKHQHIKCHMGYEGIRTKERKNEREADSRGDECRSQKNKKPDTVGEPGGQQLLYASCQRIHQ